MSLKEKSSFHTVKIVPDHRVPGYLAFRLVGNRTYGVFVCSIDQSSQQSNLLSSGDRIVSINENDARRMACDQVATIIRLSIIRQGCAYLKVCSKQAKKSKDPETRGSEGQFDFPETLSRASTLKTSMRRPDYVSVKIVSTDSFADLSPISYGSMSTSFYSSSTYDFTESTECTLCSDSNANTEFVQLISVDEHDERSTNQWLVKKKHDAMWREDRESRNDKTQCLIFMEPVQRVGYYRHITEEKGWQLLKHEWASNMKRLLSNSAYELFGSKSYERWQYTLL
ncbi:hypothetical protein AB6A40_002907 [Gnathostoma spinigerum]|uniref:PDZ domain-containing protein n=1 Tax=Gnathostoma spinigerum TaxID=75299 RepID=A0ABD6EGW9_9BILA